MKEGSLIPRLHFVEQKLFSYGGRSYSRGLTQTTKKKQSLWSCCHSCHFEIDPPSLFPPFPPHYAYSIIHTHRLLSLHIWTTKLCGNYGKCTYYSFAACISSVDFCSINCRGSAKTCISAVRRSLQLHTVSITPCRSVPFPVWLPQSGVRLLYHTQDCVPLTCSSGALNIC